MISKKISPRNTQNWQPRKYIKAINNNDTSCCLLLDFAKAFDTVNHQIILSILNQYGIRGTALQLIESYLTDREYCVQINDTSSDVNHIRHGVPQGSILGPLLFLLYINDISNSPPLLKFYLYADGTAIFLSNKDPKILKTILSAEFVHVSNWPKPVSYSLNVGKSKHNKALQ